MIPYHLFRLHSSNSDHANPLIAPMQNRAGFLTFDAFPSIGKTDSI